MGAKRSWLGIIVVTVAIVAVGWTDGDPIADYKVHTGTSSSQDWVSISVDFHSCGLHSDGTVECWGCDRKTMTGVDVDCGQCDANVGEFKSVALGMIYTCGLKKDGTLECWGDEKMGLFGSPPKGTFVAIDGGPTMMCGIETDASLACWFCARSDKSRCVPPEGRFVDVAVGSDGSCALDEEGNVHCWSCKDDSEESSLCSPPAKKFKDIDCGILQCCGVREDAGIECWGHHAGVIGNEFEAVSVGVFSCGIRTNGSIRCWMFPMDDVWVPNGDYQRVTALSVGYGYACAISEPGTVHCWGDSEIGRSTPP